MKSTTDQNVLYISTEINFGTEYVTISILARRDEDAYPINLSSWSERPEMTGIRLRGYASEYDGEFNFMGYDKPAQWHATGHHDEREIVRAAKAITKMNKAVIACNSFEAGDVLMAFAKAAGCTAYAVPEDTRFSSFRDVAWRFLPVTSARDTIRVIAKRLETEQAARGLKRDKDRAAAA